MKLVFNIDKNLLLNELDKVLPFDVALQEINEVLVTSITQGDAGCPRISGLLVYRIDAQVSTENGDWVYKIIRFTQDDVVHFSNTEFTDEYDLIDDACDVIYTKYNVLQGN